MANEIEVTATITRKNPEFFNERFEHEIKRHEKTISECIEKLSEKFGVVSMWHTVGYFTNKAIAQEMVSFIERLEFTKEEGADLSHLDGYCLQQFRQYVTCEVEASTAFTRELEADAKRKLYKMQIQFLVSMFNLPCAETIKAAMWL